MSGYCNNCGNQQCVCDAGMTTNYYWIALQWIGDTPILDGSTAFKTKRKCLKYINSKLKIENISWTMPRIKIAG